MSYPVGLNPNLQIVVTPQKDNKDVLGILKNFLDLPENELSELLGLSDEGIMQKLDLTEEDLQPYANLSQKELMERLGLTLAQTEKFLIVKLKMKTLKEVTFLNRSPVLQSINSLGVKALLNK